MRLFQTDEYVICFFDAFASGLVRAGFLISFFVSRRKGSFGWLAGLDIHCMHEVPNGIPLLFIAHMVCWLLEPERCFFNTKYGTDRTR